MGACLRSALILLLQAAVLSAVALAAQDHSFTIDYEHDTFLKDGKPFRYVSGSMHYSRVPPYYWKDRLEKLYAAGLNAVQTYVPWNYHEAYPGIFDFSGERHLPKFLKTAQEVGLVVILRAGPYMDGEWDMGGLPSWLLGLNKSILLRTSDPLYLSRVDRWMGVLLPMVRPLLYENGGPVITVQVENEYGSYYACDKAYLEHLAQTFRKHLGNSVVLFTTDGDADSYLRCGTIPSLYATVDFGIGGDPAQAFKSQRDYEPHGPLVNSEFYTGWLDYWGHPHQRRNSTEVANSLDAILKLNASVNMYMFEGGTTFGFWSGADASNNYLAVPTSYDYDAPLTEAGDPWEKYTLIRETIAKYQPVPGHIPGPTPKSDYGKVQMQEYAWLLSHTDLSTEMRESSEPLTMAEMGQDFGFLLYTNMIAKVETPSGVTLILNSLHDRAVVYTGQDFRGILTRMSALNSTVSMNFVPTSTALQIFVENMGRICYGSLINESKGLVNGVKAEGMVLNNTWQTYSFPLNNTNVLSFGNLSGSVPQSLTFFRGNFTILGEPTDTFLSVNQWTKGQAFVNDFNLGRYWPAVGPQKTLYVPASVLRTGSNKLVLFEIDKAPCSPPFDDCYAMLVKTPDIGVQYM